MLFVVQVWVVGIHARLGRGPIPKASHPTTPPPARHSTIYQAHRMCPSNWQDKYFPDQAAAVDHFAACGFQAATQAAGRNVTFFLATDTQSAEDQASPPLSPLGPTYLMPCVQLRQVL